MTEHAQPHGGELSARVGELRRLTFMYCDVVGSTELSGRQDLETYHDMMRGYRDACRDVVESGFEGHIVHIKGDGALSAFGFPVAHENDAERAVRAGLALVDAVQELSDSAARVAGESLDVRVASTTARCISIWTKQISTAWRPTSVRAFRPSLNRGPS